MARPAEDRYWLSRVLHALDEFFASPRVATVVSLTAIATVIFYIWEGNEHHLVIYTIVIEVVTLVLVFVVQHTQGREQAATQRKLDELIRALSKADSDLVQLEEESDEEMEDVAERQKRNPDKSGAGDDPKS